ncbi:4335_t:CDS:10, partial [Cetraspora pellucida]
MFDTLQPRPPPLPSTFLDLLNNTYDDADIVHMLAETAVMPPGIPTDVTLESSSTFDEIPVFKQPTPPELMPFDDLDQFEFQVQDDIQDIHEFMTEIGSSLNESEENRLNDDDNIESEDEEDFERLLSQAQAIGKDLTTGDVVPHLWQNLESEWNEFNKDLRITSGIGKIRKGRNGPRTRTLSPMLKKLLGDANLHYVNKEYPEAIAILQEVVKMDPNIHIAWFTLGTIQDEMGCPDKALQLYLVAAHLTPKDASLWKRLGLSSNPRIRNQNALHQAIYCFSKAIRCDPNDDDAIWDRCILYGEIGEYRKAIDGFKKLLQEMPYDMNIIREITKIHVQLNEIPQAIELYLDAYEYYRSRPFPEDPESEGSFGYSEINIMAELYMLTNDFSSAIDFIKRGVRWLQGRENETWWDTVADDREYEEDEKANRRDTSMLLTRFNGMDNVGGSNVPLPLELRVKLGQCRVELEQLEEAKAIEKYVDLYYEVAETYAEKGLFEDALAIYEIVVSNESTDNATAWLRIGACHRELGNLQSAVEFYKAAVEELPDDLDAKMALAEVYEGLGENERALEMVNLVLEHRKSKRATNETIKSQQTLTAQNRPIAFDIYDAPSTFLPNMDSSLIHELEETKANAFQRTQEEHKRQQAEKEKETKIQFHRLELLYARLRTGDKKSAEEFLETARILFEDLKNHRQFFPRDKALLYYIFLKFLKSSFDRRRCWRKQMALRAEAADDDDAALEEQATTMAKRLQWQIDGEIGELEAEIHKKMTEFQGLTFAQWFDFSIRYIFIATTYGYEQEAFDVLRTVSRANVFYHNSKYKTGFKLLLLGRYWDIFVCESTRWLCNFKPFDSKVYRLYGAGMASGTNALSCFASANSQKYFLRQVKSMDNISASGDKKVNAPEKPNDALLALYGHILACARSYIGAIGYYARAYAEKPKDPVISLSIGLAYLHRAMQRQTDNRHMQIMQGFTFLYNYYELKARNQEAEYNLGRAFHHLGLMHLAVPHYKKALELPSLQKVLREQKK